MKKVKKQSRKLVIFYSVIIGLLIVVAAAILIFWPESDQGSSFPWILIAIIVLGLLSLGILIVLNLRRSKYAALLQDDYYKMYESISAALQNSTLSIFERRDVLMDISDLLLQAQQNNRPINTVIGNVDDFIKGIKTSFGYRSNIVFNLLSGVQNTIYVLAIVQVAVYFMRGTDSFFNTTIGLMILPYIVFLSFLIMPLLMRYLVSRQRKVWLAAALIVIMAAVYIGVNEILHRFGMNIPWVQTYFEKEIHFISSWGILAVLIIIIALSWFIKWYIRFRSIKNLQAG
jgi:hypothetical protein